VASLAAPSGRTFPYLWAGPPSRSAPFPAGGNFVFEAGLQWSTLQDFGAGLILRNWANSDPAGNNPPDSTTDKVLEIWGDISSGVKATLAGQSVPVADPLSLHSYRLAYTGGQYTLWIDGVLKLGPTAGAVRPNAIWLGNPVFTYWNTRPWSNFDVDWLRVWSSTHYALGGRVVDGQGAALPGVAVASAAGSTVTNGAGDYLLTGVVTGTYTLTPSRPGYLFTPPSHTIAVPPAALDQDFVARTIFGGSTKTAEPALVFTGDIMTYTVRVRNSGPAPAAGVMLTDTLPAGIAYVPGSAQSSSGTVTDAGGIHWTGGVAAGGTVTVTFRATITAPAGTAITNTAAIADADLERPVLVMDRTDVRWPHRIYLPVLRRAP
jgi:uncharacterized repeat protein (TIGR01451 family)